MAGNRDFRIDLVMRAITAQARGELQKAERSIKGVNDAAGRLSKVDAGAVMRGLGVAAVAAGAVTAAVLGKYIANTIEAEKVQAQLNARLKDTGAIAGRSLGQLNDQADRLQKKTIFDDEAIGGAQAMLLTFKQIREVNFDRSVDAAADLATVMGTDIADAAKLLGRALNDPSQGLAALTRAGVTFTEGERDKIKAMVEAGRTADAQTLILNKLEGTMGSAAEAARDTLGGALQALKNSFDNLLEGDAGDAGVVGVRNAVEDLISLLNEPETKQGFDNLIAGAVSAIQTMVRLATTTANVTRFIGEELAARANGAAATDTVRVQERIERLQKTMAAVQDLRATGSPIAAIKQVGDISELVPGDLLSRPDTVVKRLQGELDKEKNKLRIGIELNEDAVRRAAEIAKAAQGGTGGGGVADPDIAVTKKSKGSKADPEAAAKRRLADMQEEIALLGQLKDGEEKASEAAKIRYAITEGEFKNVNPALKQQLLDQAELLDQKQASIEAEKKQAKAAEEAKKAYDDLKESLRTPAEAALDEAIAKVEALNAAIRAGVDGAQEYGDEALGKIARGLTDKQPEFQGLAPEVGGAYGELSKLDEATASEEKWYQDSLARNAAFRAERTQNKAAADAEEERIEALHQQRMHGIDAARQQAALSIASDFFGQLATLQRSENSKIAAVGKAAAIAQAIINTYQSATAAYAAMASIPYVGPALGVAAAAAAVAAGLANVAQIRAQPTGGYAEGGYTGPGGKFEPAGVVHKGEGVLSQEEIRALGGPGGFQALRDAIDEGSLRERLYGWAGYAEGGFVGNPDRPALPSPDWASHPQGADGLASNVTNRLAVMNFLDPDDLADALSRSSRFNKHVVNTVVGEGGTIRAGWQE
jgi:hypothetical protein